MKGNKAHGKTFSPVIVFLKNNELLEDDILLKLNLQLNCKLFALKNLVNLLNKPKILTNCFIQTHHRFAYSVICINKYKNEITNHCTIDPRTDQKYIFPCLYIAAHGLLVAWIVCVLFFCLCNSCCINGPNHACYGLQDRGAPQIKACLLLPCKACININLVCRELLGVFREAIYS